MNFQRCKVVDVWVSMDPIEALRQTADATARSLQQGDFARMGAAMIENTHGQRLLHPDLVNPAAEHIIEIGRDFGVLGHKVNGAGGNGGSIALLTDGDRQAKINLTRAIQQEQAAWHIVPIKLSSDGLKVEEEKTPCPQK